LNCSIWVQRKLSKESALNYGKKHIHLEALAGQLEFLKSRIQDRDASQWRQMGKLAQDFTVWLERAKPWMSCASNLIALRVEQVMGDVVPDHPCDSCLVKLSDLMEEAGRQLSHPGLPIQVIDLKGNGKACPKTDEGPYPATGGVSLPPTLIEIPEILRPQGNVPVQFLYIIPN